MLPPVCPSDHHPAAYRRGAYPSHLHLHSQSHLHPLHLCYPCGHKVVHLALLAPCHGQSHYHAAVIKRLHIKHENSRDGSSLGLTSGFIPAFALKRERDLMPESVCRKDSSVLSDICLKPSKFNHFLQSHKKGQCKEHNINKTG